MAAYFIRPILPKPIGIFLLVIVAFAAGLHLGWIDKTKASFRAFGWIRNGIVVISVIITTLVIGSWVTQGPGVNWQPYSEGLLTKARKINKPVIIDFYADWCSPCRELEEITFHDATIVKQAKQDFIMIKVDLTRKGNPLHEQLLKKYEIKGVPTVVFLNGKGKERNDLRLVDYLPASQVLTRMAEAKKLL
jgi:thiol:disulfide interchange protein DsbD